MFKCSSQSLIWIYYLNELKSCIVSLMIYCSGSINIGEWNILINLNILNCPNITKMPMNDWLPGKQFNISTKIGKWNVKKCSEYSKYSKISVIDLLKNNSWVQQRWEIYWNIVIHRFSIF